MKKQHLFIFVGLLILFSHFNFARAYIGDPKKYAEIVGMEHSPCPCAKGQTETMWMIFKTKIPYCVVWFKIVDADTATIVVQTPFFHYIYTGQYKEQVFAKSMPPRHWSLNVSLYAIPEASPLPTQPDDRAGYGLPCTGPFKVKMQSIDTNSPAVGQALTVYVGVYNYYSGTQATYRIRIYNYDSGLQLYCTPGRAPVLIDTRRKETCPCTGEVKPPTGVWNVQVNLYCVIWDTSKGYYVDRIDSQYMLRFYCGGGGGAPSRPILMLGPPEVDIALLAMILLFIFIYVHKKK